MTSKQLMGKLFGAGVLFLLFVSTFALASQTNTVDTDQSIYSSTGTRDYTHTVLVEVGTAQWCPPCASWNTYLHNLYPQGTYDFEYVELIVEDPYGRTRNNDAEKRAIYDLGLPAWPTTYIDGHGPNTAPPAYYVVGGYPSTFINYLNLCGARDVADLTADMQLTWLGDAEFKVDIVIQNNEGTQYNGHIRAYITEIVSRYNTDSGTPYGHGFLAYAFDKDISIDPFGFYNDTTTWDGKEHSDALGVDFDDISRENIQVVLAVFDGSTEFVDETIAAEIPLQDCGDVNDDGMLSVSDAVFLINALIIPEAPYPEPLCIADVNGDSFVNISDVVFIINYLFIPGSPAPLSNCC